MNPLLLTGLFDVAKGLIDRFFPDPAQKAAATLELAKMQQTGELAQLAATTDLAKAQIGVNLAEASSTSIFIAGWRPFCGWIGGLGLGYAVLLEPLARFVAQVGFDYKGAFPVIDTSMTTNVLLGMLGLLGGMRTLEKVKGAEGNR
mgnify:CR=1 FL=1